MGNPAEERLCIGLRGAFIKLGAKASSTYYPLKLLNHVNHI